MRIANNITAINSHRQYNVNATAIGRNMEKLSSGYRINRSADDSAGLAISEKMRAQIRGLNMASKNSQDAISLVQTAEGALQTTHDILQRMRELAVQAASDSNQNEIDREALNAEFQQMITEIDDTANKTKFNNMGLIDGNYDPTREYYLTPGENGVTFTIQSGANMWDESAIAIQAMNWQIITETAINKAAGYRPPLPDYIDNIDLNYGPEEGANYRIPELRVTLHDRLNASYAITIVNAAVNVVSTQRALLGALQNRLEYKVKNLDISAENLQAAESRIRDADMAKMMTEFTKNNILFQASTAMLAQANALPQGVLQLLG
jgi:flagellin